MEKIRTADIRVLCTARQENWRKVLLIHRGSNELVELGSENCAMS